MTPTSTRSHYLAALGIEQWVRRERHPHAQQNETDRPLLKESDLSDDLNSASPELRTDAASSQVWQTLRANVAQCTACELHQSRSQTVFGAGNEQAKWLIIGEAPGAEEDLQGEPFVGRAGKLLDNMLHALGLNRNAVYIANILKCRPPNNRDPRAEEVACCERYLRQQVALINPSIILALGRIAAQNLLKNQEKIGSMRGKRYEYANTGIPIVATYHPAYLLRAPREKSKSWQDLLFAKSIIEHQTLE
ncbi:MAG: uracil-DNA glycosylase family protein [Thiohalomonadales bacterium]